MQSSGLYVCAREYIIGFGGLQKYNLFGADMSMRYFNSNASDLSNSSFVNAFETCNSGF